MKKSCITLTLTLALAALASFADEEVPLPQGGEIVLEGDYAGHLQDVWYDGKGNLYWAHTQDLLKTDLSGKILRHVKVEDHHAGIQVKDGKVYVAVCQMQTKTGGKTLPESRVTIGEYDAETLELVKMHVTDINDRSGSLAILDDGTFVIGCLRPQDIGKTQVRFHHLDRDFRLLDSHVVDNVPVKLGIEVVKWHAGRLYLCVYGGPDTVLLDSSFREVGRERVGGALGLVFSGRDTWVGRTSPDKETKRYTSRLVRRAEPSRELKNVFTSGEKFYTGCNYWASNAGMYMWRRWNPQAVEKDIAELSKNGVNIMRVFPLWPDFQPLTRLLGGGGWNRGLYQNDKPLENEAGVDEEMMRRFRFMCDVSEKHGVKLVVGLVTGWMSGRLFVPPAFEAKIVLTDPEVMMWQVRFVRHFVREMKDHPAIAGWDLGNECNCMASADQYQSWNWMNAIASAIRAEDVTRPVVSGMHSCSNVTRDGWNLDMQGELMDELTTHPYPLFTPGCAREVFNTMRSESHPTMESLLYWGLSGRHCFVEEAGDLGRNTASPERSAANVRCAMYTAWANGLGAYVWWCGFDQQHLEFPPYTWNAVERELGLFTKDYETKPVLREMGAFRKFVDALPKELQVLPARQVDAVVLVSDRERAWASAAGAYLLAKQAGFDVRFASAEKFPLPEAKLYVFPSGDGCDPYSYEAWNAMLAKAESGATVLVSKGNGTRYSGFLAATGNEIESFCQQNDATSFELKGCPGRKISAWNNTTTRIVPKTSEVLAATADGRAMVTASRYGKGRVVYCNFAIESDSFARPDCFSGKDVNPRYLVYQAAAKIAGVKRRVTKGLPNVGLTEHPLADGRTVVVAVNYDDFAVTCPIALDGSLGKVWRGKVSGKEISFEANDVAVFEVK